MRRLSRPASGRVSGSTFSASHEPPGRRGASHNSHARPSTINPSRLPTARARVQSTTVQRFIGGIIPAMNFPKRLQLSWRDRFSTAAADPPGLALARHAQDPAPALPRRPARHDRQQPDLHDHHRAGALLHRHAGDLLGLSDVRKIPDGAGEVLHPDAGARQHRQAGAARADPVRDECQPARNARPGASGGDCAGVDADHRPHAQRDLARAHARGRSPSACWSIGPPPRSGPCCWA